MIYFFRIFFSHHLFGIIAAPFLIASTVSAANQNQFASIALKTDEEKSAREHALELFNQVDKALQAKLDRPDAPPSYPEAYRAFKSREEDCIAKIADNPQNIGSIIGLALESSGLSHLSFRKLQNGSLGFETEELTDGAVRLVKVFPYSEAAALGLKAGDIVQSISNKPAAEVMRRGILEDSEYGKQTLQLADMAIPCLFMHVIGICGALENGWFRIHSIAPGSPATLIDLKPEDLICIIPMRTKVFQSSIFLTPIIVNVSKKPICIKAVREDYFTRAGWGFYYDSEPNLRGSVLGIYPNSPAEMAGLQYRDTVFTVTPTREYQKGQTYLHGDKAMFLVQKKNGQRQQLELTASLVSEYQRTIFKEIEYDNKKISYLRIENCGEKYEPEVVHHGFTCKAAQENQIVIIDLRGSEGGRSEHLLSYLLKPGSPCKIEHGRASNQKGSVSPMKKMVHIPSFEQLRTGFAWSHKVKSEPIPFRGQVGFIVNKQTNCAAEICAIIPLEYFNLKNSSQPSDLYHDALYPHKIFVVGTTLGQIQTLGEQKFDSSLGSFVLCYPTNDIHSAVSGHNLEGKGVFGHVIMPLSLENYMTKPDPELDCVLEELVKGGVKSYDLLNPCTLL